MIINKSYTKADLTKKYDIIFLDPEYNKYDELGDLPESKYIIAFVDTGNEDEVKKRFGKPDATFVWTYTVGKQKVSGQPCNSTFTFIYIYSNVGKLKIAENGVYNHRLVPTLKGKSDQKPRLDIGIREEEPLRAYIPKIQKQLTSSIQVNRIVEEGKSSYTKPEFIVFILLEYLSDGKEGTTVFDPFAGSGIVGQICKRMRYEYTGYEIVKEKVIDANKEIEDIKPMSVRLEKLYIHLRYMKERYRGFASGVKETLKIIAQIEKHIKSEKRGENHTKLLETSSYREILRNFILKNGLLHDRNFLKRSNILRILNFSKTEFSEATKIYNRKLYKKKKTKEAA